jgi:hypothetical protein
VAVWIRVPRLYVLPQRWPLVRFDPNLSLLLSSRSLLGSTKPAGRLVRKAAANHGPTVARPDRSVVRRLRATPCELRERLSAAIESTAARPFPC